MIVNVDMKTKTNRKYTLFQSTQYDMVIYWKTKLNINYLN